MQWESIVYFLAVAKHKSFTKAAESLYFTQSHLSRRIAILEQDLGVRLFDRDRKHVELTPAGELFYQKSLEIDHMMEEIVNTLKTYSGDSCEGIPPLRIRCGAFCESAVETICQVFSKNNSAVPIIQTYEILETIPGKAPFDVEVVFEVPSSAKPGIAIFHDTECVHISKHCALSKHDHLSIEDLKDLTIVLLDTVPRHRYWEQVIQDRITNPQITHTKSLYEMLDALIVSENNVVIWPAYITRKSLPDRTIVPLEEALQGVVKAIPYDAGTKSAIISQFMQASAEIAKPLDEECRLNPFDRY